MTKAMLGLVLMTLLMLSDPMGIRSLSAASLVQDGITAVDETAQRPLQDPTLGYNINLSVFDDTNGNGVRDDDETYVMAKTQWDFNADPCSYNAEGILQCAGFVAP
ncbi:MAG: hypothetical protein AAF639_43310, partial [Chloroflexota bacterium]